MSTLHELLQKKKAAIAATRRGRATRIPDGASRWRIMGGWRAGDPTFWHDFGTHFIKNEAGQNDAVYICTFRTFGKNCAVCDALKQAEATVSTEGGLNALKESKAGARVLINAVDLTPGSDPSKVQVVEMPPSLFEQVINTAELYEKEGVSIFGSQGKDLIINRSGKGLNTKYSVSVAPSHATIPVEYDAKVNNLDEYVAQESTEQQQRALTSVRTLAGLLPAPAVAAAGLPAPARAAAMMFDAAPTPFEDVPDLTATPPWTAQAAPAVVAAPAAAPAVVTVAPAVTVTPTPPAAPAAAPAADGVDDELKRLMESLGG